MRLGLVRVGEEAGALEDNFDTHVCPFDGGRVFLRRDFDRLAIDDKIAILRFDRTVIRSIGGVVFQQVGIGWRIEQVVHRDNFDFIRVPLFDGAKDQTSNPAKAVNTYFYSHFKPPKFVLCDEGYKTIVSPLLEKKN